MKRHASMINLERQENIVKLSSCFCFSTERNSYNSVIVKVLMDEHFFNNELVLISFNQYEHHWLLPRKHLLLFKMSWRRLRDMSWRRLQNVFSVTIFRLPKRLEDFLKTSWKTKNCYAEGVLKTCLQDVFKISSRSFQDMSSRRLQDVLETSKMFTGNICI